MVPTERFVADSKDKSEASVIGIGNRQRAECSLDVIDLGDVQI